jgi:regulator of sirC expression with transglutaminase-like and TPR domain
MLANLKAIHAAQGKMDRALWTAEWMILLKSNDFSSLRDKGMFLFSLGRLEEAEKALLQYLEDTKRPADYTAIWKALYSIRAQNPSHLN